MKNDPFATRYTTEELACPQCGQMQKYKKYAVINPVEKPGLKEDILKNRGAFVFRCGACGYEAPLTYESLYYDAKKKYALCLSPFRETPPRAETLPDGAARRRLVDNINDLKEKILIAEAGLDDRVVEIIKIQYLRQLDRELVGDTLLNILFDSDSRGNLCFLVFFKNKGVGKMALSRDYYEKIRREYEEKLPARPDGDPVKVDMEWAGELFFRRS